MIPESDHRPKRPVAVGQLSKVGERLGLGQRWRQLECTRHPDLLRHGLLDQFIKIGQAERGQHFVPVVDLRTDVPRNEGSR